MGLSQNTHAKGFFVKNYVYLKRRATFCASHRLDSPHLTKEENAAFYGKCNWENGHGHNYILYVTIRGEIDPKTGLVMNFVDLKRIVNEVIVDRLDHKHLNFDIPELKDIIPSAENLCVIFWNWLKPHFPEDALYEIFIQETENNEAFYRGIS